MFLLKIYSVILPVNYQPNKKKKMYLKLAWRNIWRNQRRTFLSIFSVFLAVSLSIFVRSQYLGAYESMMQNTVGAFLGYIQIQQKKYVENPSIQNTFENNPTLHQQIKSVKGIKNIIPRLTLSTFVGSQSKKKVGLIVGIDLQKEQYVSHPLKRLIQGEYFEQNGEKAVILAEKLAKTLQLKIGDSLEVLGKDFYTKPIKVQFLVKGIVKIPQPQLSQKLLYIPLKTCQDLFQTQHNISSYILDIDTFENKEQISQSLQKKLRHTKLKVVTWDKSNPELKQILLVQDIASSMVIFVLYMIVGFGMFATVLMMLTERQTEFKILISIGLKRQKLAFILFIEVIFLGFLGIILSIAGTFPILFYLNQNPIALGGEMAQLMQEVGMPAQLNYSVNVYTFISPALIIFVLHSMIALYIFRYVAKLQLVKD